MLTQATFFAVVDVVAAPRHMTASVDGGSRKRKRDEGHVALLGDSVDCPICFTMMLGKIVACNDGHHLCEDCFAKLEAPKRCGTCREVFPTPPPRQRGLEQLIERFELPCEHNDCGFVGKVQQLLKHRKVCAYALVECPECKAQISLNKMCDHLIEAHPEDLCKAVAGGTKFIFDIPKASFNEDDGRYALVKFFGDNVIYIILDWGQEDVKKRGLVQCRFFHFIKQETMQITVAETVHTMKTEPWTEPWESQAGAALGKGCVFTAEMVAEHTKDDVLSFRFDVVAPLTIIVQ
jgi:hypothetical protein